MAEVVLGLGTSHGPMLSTVPERWDIRVPDDKRSRLLYRGKGWSFDELVVERQADGLEREITLETWRRKHAECRRSLDTLADIHAAAKVDIAIVVGNDQMEIFDDTLIPALSVLYGSEITNSMYSDDRMAKLPPGIPDSVPGHIPPGGATYPGSPELGSHIIRTAIADNFDIAAMRRMPKEETPHAYGFVYRQIMRDVVIPSVPVVLNTFYPPNQPTVTRCFDLGRSIARAIKSWDSPLRVGLYASGGLTHFVVDEQVDRAVIEGMRRGDIASIAAFGEEIYQAGTSEVKNWVVVAGAMAELGFDMKLVDYIPCYRSLAGTGCAMTFAYWMPPQAG